MTKSLAEELCGLAAVLEEFEPVGPDAEVRRASTHQLLTMDLPDALRGYAARAAVLEGVRCGDIVDLRAIFARERADRRAGLTVIEGGAA